VKCVFDANTYLVAETYEIPVIKFTVTLENKKSMVGIYF